MAIPLKGLVIFGAGGHGRVVASTARTQGWSDISFVDPKWPELRSAGDWPVEADGHDLSIIGTRAVMVAIGDNQRRLSLLEELARAGLELTSVVHASAWVCPGVSIGVGTVVNAMVAINYGASLGRGVIVNTGAVVEHDCTLADGVHVSPRAVLAGGATVGRCAWIGTGASIRPAIRIGDGAIVGAGAAVVSEVPLGATYVGVPAREMTIRPAKSD